MEKQQVIDRLENTMYGCNTPVYVCDPNGANGSYTNMLVDDLLCEEYDCFIPSDNWQLLEVKSASVENTDIEIWAQEFSQNEIDALRNTLRDGKLSIARFFSEKKGYMDIMIWKD